MRPHTPDAAQLPLPARIAVALENDERLDPAVDALGEVTAPLGAPGLGDVLRGAWLGHALHPSLTDVPLGLWTAASVLDLVGGPSARPAAQRLLGVGLLSVAPTAASGWAEWHRSDRPSQRVGVAHAALNVAAIGLYAGSWAARRGDRHRLGTMLALVGAGTAGAAGYLGGHLAAVRKVSTAAPGMTQDSEPRSDDGDLAVSATNPLKAAAVTAAATQAVCRRAPGELPRPAQAQPSVPASSGNSTTTASRLRLINGQQGKDGGWRRTGRQRAADTAPTCGGNRF